MAKDDTVAPEEFGAQGDPDPVVDPAPEETVQVDYDVVDQLDPEGIDTGAVQVQDTTVVFVPQKDFTGRVNDQEYSATKGVPVKIPRDVANIWLEDESRGYVRD